MPFASKIVLRSWLFITVISIVAVYGSEEKRLDFKIGFDLTQGANGAPSLRIRDFKESSELNTRAKEDTESKETKPNEKSKVRADSFSDSNEEPGKSQTPIVKLESSKESKDKPKSNNEDAKSNNDDAKSNNDDSKSDDDDDDSSEAKLSTRGLKPGDYEPEENPKIHGSYRESEEDSDKLRRHKRHALFRSKGKWRKFI